MSRPTAFEDKWSRGAPLWSNSVTQQQWRVISSTGNQRQRLQKVVTNTVEGGGNPVRSSSSRAWHNAGYELSQDLHAKQVEILEKKYGGSWRSRHAATIIQRAYRHYCLTRNFAKLRWEADEKRLSRRFAEFSHSRTVWSDLASTIQREEESRNETAAERSHMEMIYSEYDNIMTHSYSSDNMLHHFMAHKTSRGFRQTATVTARPTEHGRMTTNAKINLVLDRCNLDFDFGESGGGRIGEVAEATTGQLLPASSSENSYVSGHGQFELSDSGESMLSSPLEPMVDLPSTCFENQLEKEVEAAEVLDDSFSSESCEDGDLTPVNESSNSSLCRDHQKSLGATAAAAVAAAAAKGRDSCVTGTTDMKDGACASKSVPKTSTSNGSPTKSSPKSPVDKVPSKTDEGTLNSEEVVELSPDGSPIWKRKSRNLEGVNSLITDGRGGQLPQDAVRYRGGGGPTVPLDTICDCRETPSGAEAPSQASGQVLPISCKASVESLPPSSALLSSSECLHSAKISDRCRKRAYRIGLNLFNKKPENGVRYLIMRGFLEQRPNAVAKFLISRKGLSKQMVGEYLGNLQKPFNMEVLRCFANEIELAGLSLDVALRKFQSYFRMPGEAQKIERLMEAFATRYCQCNPEHMDEFRSSEMVFLLAFAVIMLNTDLHNSNIKPDRKMKVNDFIRNLRGIDGGQDIDATLLTGIYERIRVCELKPGADHVSHVFRLEQMIFGNKPQLSLPHRRLVCYCRMYEVLDPLRRDKAGQHQRELFLFNDVLMITKIFNKKKKKTPLYSFRQMFSLFGMVVHIFESPFYKYGLRLSASLGGNVLIMLNARNEHDRTKFVDDLKESILEITEMEGLRIEEELKKQKFCQSSSSNFARYSKDSGVVDVEMLKLADASVNRLSAPECERLKKSPLCNSLVDIADHTRRGSGVSLDSGVASAESESVGSCQEPHRSSRFLGLPPTTVPNAPPNQGPNQGP